jgi:hypothetical protein
MDRLYPLTVTIPAQTPILTPVNQPFPLEDAELVYVHINVPPGPSSLMGFRILQAGQQIIPWGNNSFFVTDDEKIEVAVGGQITATGLIVQGYNTDVFDHTIYLRALIRDLPLPSAIDTSGASSALALPGSESSDQTDNGIDTLTSNSANITGDVTSPDQLELPPDLTEQPITDVTDQTDTSVTPVTVPDTTPIVVESFPPIQPPIPIGIPPVLPPPKPPIKKPVPKPPVKRPVKIKVTSKHTLTKK